MEIIGGATLYQGDCLEIMPEIAAGSVDLILADLPYGVTACEWDKILPFEKLWPAYERLLKPNGAVVLTASQPFTTKLISSKMDWYRMELIWKKNTVTGFMNVKHQPLKNHENVIVFSPVKTTKMAYHPQGLIAVNRTRKITKCRIYNQQAKGTRQVNFTHYPRTVMEFDSETEHRHPTQKPVAMLAYLINTFSDPGAVVLDNTMGVGSTGVAALQVGRSFIGIEIGEEYYQWAVERIKKSQGLAGS
ncbi:MAG: site-specific DNA-methyltransferase [Anaerolineaceae bacterium]